MLEEFTNKAIAYIWKNYDINSTNNFII